MSKNYLNTDCTIAYHNENAEDGLGAVVITTANDYRVSFWDLDADASIGLGYIYPFTGENALARATAKADEFVLGVAA